MANVDVGVDNKTLGSATVAGIDTANVGSGAPGSGNEQLRQVMVLGDPTTAAAEAAVENATPGSADYGSVVRPASLPPLVTSSTTNITSAPTTVVIPLNGYPSLAIKVVRSGFTGGHEEDFSVDGGNSWILDYGPKVINGSDGISDNDTYTLDSSTSYHSVVIPLGATHIRFNVTTLTAGSLTVQYFLSATPPQPAPVVKDNPTNVWQPLGYMIGGFDDTNHDHRFLRMYNTLPTPTTWGTVVRPASGLPDNSAGPYTINGNGQSTTAFAVAGYAGVAAKVVNSAFNGTLQAQQSFDGGSTWFTVPVVTPVGGAVSILTSWHDGTLQFSDSSTTMASFSLLPGASHVRITSTAFTSGSTAISFRASMIATPVSAYFDDGSGGSPLNLPVGGSRTDISGLSRIRLSAAQPSVSDIGLIVRPASTASDTSGAMGSATPASAILVGAGATSTTPAAATAGNLIDLLTDLLGRAITWPFGLPDSYSDANPSVITTATTTQLYAAAGSGLRWYLTDLTVINSHTQNDCTVTISDVGGTIWQGICMHGGGGFALTFSKPKRQPNSNAVVNVVTSAAANVLVSAGAVKSAT